MADPIQVNLKPPSGSNGWMMKVGTGQWTAGPNYPKIPVDTGKKADITFAIQNGAGQTAKFSPDPILVPVKSKVFDQPVVATDGLSFEIHDKNPDKEQIPYVLMFQNAPKLDPIIDNGGGNRMESITLSFIEAGGLFLLSLALGMVLQRAFRLLG